MINQRYFSLIATAFAVVMTSTVSFAETVSSKTVIDKPTIATEANDVTAASRLAQLMGNFKTFTAYFSQQVLNDKNKVIQRNHGSVTIERPGKFRWVSQIPTQQIIIANGPVLWTYDVDLQTATQQPFQQSGGVTPANLLSGDVADLQKQFNITQLPAISEQQTYQLLPKTKNDLLQSVIMTFKNNQLFSMQVNNNIGKKILFLFTNVQLNKPVAASFFQFEPPKGVDVINNG